MTREAVAASLSGNGWLQKTDNQFARRISFPGTNRLYSANLGADAVTVWDGDVELAHVAYADLASSANPAASIERAAGLNK
ncbi:hypothetical protein [Erythrobacter aureus]|uniref:Uncharacterized protein n=1 Tax=Erythrobacter aureus TaxID=2182384 RepID=A0A345YIQ2_9SPHN|nr:hypothetical protein [Erythrobacter aureus]AXK43804.1 hypothetical protein DVR09_15215 [Erythrobacter aureus]